MSVPAVLLFSRILYIKVYIVPICYTHGCIECSRNLQTALIMFFISYHKSITKLSIIIFVNKKQTGNSGA